MYGKLFQSCFTGSMFGAGPAVFAVWAYAISHVVKGRVELNPRMLAPTIGADVDTIEQAIQYLSSPDPNSRSPECEGRRLVREGQFQYFLPTHAKYQALRNEDDRRAYNRQKQAESRERRRTAGVKVSTGVSMTVNDTSAMSAEEETDENVVQDVGVAKIIAASPLPAMKPRCAAGAAPASTDLDWLQSLKTDPAYAGIDVEREHAKMVRWCVENRKQATRRRLVNWLNRADRVLQPAGSGTSWGDAAAQGRISDIKAALAREYDHVAGAKLEAELAQLTARAKPAQPGKLTAVERISAERRLKTTRQTLTDFIDSLPHVAGGEILKSDSDRARIRGLKTEIERLEKLTAV